MPPLSAAEIRERFQRFFEARDHTRVPPAPLLARDDPTLLFTNSGMVQFKRVLTGEESRDYRRAVDSQPCLRVAGKHNDFEEVGRTPRHQTLFEMLGNWSFGDYFKTEAIHWAWEFLTDDLGIAPDRLAATVYSDDDDAHRIWATEIGLPPERLVRWGNIAAGDDHNFWQMADVGPCGPCSEIHYDRGAELSEGPDCVPDHSETCPRWLEIWNLVFMQYDRAADGTLTPLPFQSVDTGMGLERTASVMQGVDSNYRTDLFVPIIDRLAEHLGHRPEEVEAERFSYQVVADHSRAMTFLIAEGVHPTNDGAGYVLRRIMRRAVRHVRLMGISAPVLGETCAAVIDLMGDAYPTLAERREAILDEVRAEEARFARTLEAGSERLAPAGRRGRPGWPDRGRRGIPAARHLRLPDRPHDRDRGGIRRRGRPRWLRHGDDRPARAVAGRAARRIPIRPRACRPELRPSSAIRTRRWRRMSRSSPSAPAATAPRPSSWPRPRSMPRVVARSATTGAWSGLRGTLEVTDTQRDGDAIVHLGSLEGNARGGGACPRRGRPRAAAGGGPQPHGHPSPPPGAAQRPGRAGQAGRGAGSGPMGCGSTSRPTRRRRAMR